MNKENTKPEYSPEVHAIASIMLENAVKKHFRPEWNNSLLDVGEDKPVSLTEFLKVNLFEKNIDHISLEDAQRVINLQPGESTFVNITEIKRVS